MLHCFLFPSKRPKQGDKKKKNKAKKIGHLQVPYGLDYVEAPQLARRASKHGDVELIKSLLSDHGPGVFRLSRTSQSLNASCLHLASGNGHVEASEILSNVEDINIQDDHGFTPLMRALSRNQTKVAEMLIAKGAEINIRDNFGQTALFVAAEFCDRATLKRLVRAGGDPMIKCMRGKKAQDVALRFDKYNNAAILHNAEKYVMKKKFYTFLMGTQERLGEESMINKLPKEVHLLISENMLEFDSNKQNLFQNNKQEPRMSN